MIKACFKNEISNKWAFMTEIIAEIFAFNITYISKCSKIFNYEKLFQNIGFKIL